MTPPTNPPSIALLSATAGAGAIAVAFAYCSFTSNTTAFVNLVFKMLYSKRTQEKSEDNEDKITDKKEKKSENSDSIEECKGDDFVSWLDREENETDFFHPGNNHCKSKANTITDPCWMSATIRDALHLTAASGAEVKNSIDFSLVEEPSYTPSIYPSAHTKSKKEPDSASGSHDESNDEQTQCEISFSRSFISLQKATKRMMDKEPAIREDFFNGFIVDGDKDQWEEETKQQRRRSLSLSSSSSSWSGTSSSMSSYQLNEADSLVEEEEEVERLLMYLRFVELAIKESSSISSKDDYDRTSSYLSKGGQGIAPDINDYELVRFASIVVDGTTEMQRANVSHITAVHRDRKELVIAVHYDVSSLSTFASDDPNRIKGILMSSLLQQQQEQSLAGKTPASNSFFLLHEAAKSLSEEILFRYLHKNTAEKKDSSSFFLSSGYSLVICGHSLGAALACQLGDLLTNRNRDKVSDSFQVRVCAFGPPPCLPLRRKSLLEGDESEGEYNYITSVVNNHDCVPRWTESNLLALQMSLNSLMGRKRQHFQRYRNMCDRCSPSANPAISGKSAVTRRSSALVPPFSEASRDWKMFWTDDQEPNTFLSQCSIDESTPTYIVPGKVVSIWNHSQDPMIIGAKVHSPERKRRHRSSNDLFQFSRRHRGNRKNYDVLGRLWIDEGMFSDHTIEAYRSNLELLLGQVTNTI